MKLLLLCACVVMAHAGLAPLITSSQRAVPDSWIVRVKDFDLMDQVTGEILGRFTKMRLPSPKVTKLRMLPLITLKVPARLLTDIRSIDGIEYIEQNKISTIAGTQMNPTWGLDRIDNRLKTDGMYKFNDYSQGYGVNVYVADTGIQTTHDAFGGRVSLLFGGKDDHGHGTHCAGTAAGNTYGIARHANLQSVKVCTRDGLCYQNTILDGVQAIIDHGGMTGGIVSMSLGGTASSPTMDDMAKRLWQSNFLLVHAAGNMNDDACFFSPQMAKSYLISVGATDSNDQRAPFSNYGSCVEIFAPGVFIESAGYSETSNSQSDTMSGTSMATPHVAGVAAVLLGIDKNSSPMIIKDSLIVNATPWIISDDMGSSNLLLYIDPIWQRNHLSAKSPV